MATHSIGEGKVPISTTVPASIGEEIERRAAAMTDPNTTKSGFGRLIIQWWWDQGAPCVHEGDVAGKRKEWAKAAPFLEQAFENDAVFAAFEAVMLETMEKLKRAKDSRAKLPELDTE